MKVRLLPSNIASPTEVQTLTSFLVDDRLVIDGGSVGFALDFEQQRRLRDFVITHTHADHIASLPLTIADLYTTLDSPVVVYGVREVVDDLREHIFNERIWPDFSKIPLCNCASPSLELRVVEEERPFTAAGLQITPVRVNHPVVCTGLLVTDGTVTVAFTSDTHKTDRFWAMANQCTDLKAVFVDVSFSSDHEELGVKSGHLTPTSLVEELEKLERDVMVYAVHIKPHFRRAVVDEIERLANPRIAVAAINREYTF
jgi:cAMP phosphodiesterase